MRPTSDELLSAAREHRFLTAAAGFAVGYAFVSFLGALVNTLVTEIVDQPGQWTFVLTTLFVLALVVVVALTALAWARNDRRAA